MHFFSLDSTHCNFRKVIIRVSHDGIYLLKKDIKLKRIEKFGYIEGHRIFGIQIEPVILQNNTSTQPKPHQSRDIHSFHFSGSSSKLTFTISGLLSDFFFFSFDKAAEIIYEFKVS